MRRKLIALVTALAVLMSASGIFASTFVDVAEDSKLSDVVSVLGQLGVVSGKGDGVFDPDGYLTRAEFAKIAAVITGDAENAASSTAAEVFTDVSKYHWASNYIALVSSKGLIAGYPNGTFGAEEQISYAQVLTILVRALGYTADEVGYHWPSDYITKAGAIKLTADTAISDIYAPATRAVAAQLIYNALFTDLNGTNVALISKLDITHKEDVIVYADRTLDSSLTADAVRTSDGVFKVTDTTMGVEENIGRRGDLYLDKDNKIVLFRPSEQKIDSYIVTGYLFNADSTRAEVTVSEDGTRQTLYYPASSTVYFEGTASNMKALATEFTEGSTLTVLSDASGNYDYALLSSYSMEGPVTVMSNDPVLSGLFDLTDASTLRIVRDGQTAQASDLTAYDVAYYAANTNTIYAYSDRLTGTYDKAMPQKATVTSVTVSGTEYTLATQTAINKMNASEGAFAIGDRVTLLFGRNGEVVDVVDLTAASTQNLGVVLKTFTEVATDGDNRGRSEDYAKMYLSDGTTVNYKTDRDYELLKGELVRISISDGTAKLTKIGYNVQSGELDKETPSFNDHWFANGYSILELVDNPENGEAVVKRIYLSDINASSLTKSQVIHVETTGSMNDISLLYLNNVSQSKYTFGVVIREGTTQTGSGSTTNGVYTVLMNGEERTFSFGNRRVINSSVLGVNLSDTSDVVEAVRMASGSKFTAYSGDRMRLDNTVYRMADDVQIYAGRNASEYRAVSLDDAVAMQNVTSVMLYGEKTVQQGGLVKMIVMLTSV